MARWVVAPSSLLLLALLLLPLAEGSDVWGALQSRDNPSHSAVALIFAFGLAVIVVIVSIVVLTLCCCDRPPKRQYYVTSSGSGGGPVGAPAAVVAATPPASTGPAGGPRCTRSTSEDQTQSCSKREVKK